MRHPFGLALALQIASIALFAQQPARLPANYKPIFENADVLVQRVHYGPHEVVPMHDHPAATTVYVYLNDSGIVDIRHEGGEIIHRPPTHTGAFRISPGNFERHSVENTSDISSDFLRIELKRLPIHSISAQFRGDAPQGPLSSGSDTLYNNPALRIDRLICVPGEKCAEEPSVSPSLLVVVPLKSPPDPNRSPVVWCPANKSLADITLPIGPDLFGKPLEILRITLPKQ